ncbi:hypothetical protein SADUNF_Sadunf14G0103100 [Salix dunnii]|uniref:CCHC-type domain-containing protein n=1 Tax=Salix dunnii TaxID=1413687 RepID=A0A835JIQ5_9ROSI|nr:hypothetical protein SADUNF_Sadunf14G0103100 [Salix dunnii]
MQQNPAAATWLRMDQLVLGWINSSLSDGPLSQVINCESCHDAWMVLETLYGSHTRDRIQQMKGELQTLNKGSYSLEDYLHKAKSLALSLRGAGKPMDDDDLIVCILRGLGSEYDPIVAALNARDMFPSLEGVIGKLRDFEIRLQNAKTTPPNLAFYTNRYRAHAKSQGNVNMRERTGGYSKNQHQFQGRSRDTYNTRSGETYNTRSGENSSRNKMSSFTRPNRSSGRGRGGITCFRCGGPNHKANGCFASDDEAAQYKAFAAIQVRDTTDDSWYPDTGANQHMTSNPNEVQDSLTDNEVPVTDPVDPSVMSSNLPEVSATEPATTSPIQSALPSIPTEPSSSVLPSRLHPMVTRAQTGNLKPKTFFSTRHPIPICFLAELTAMPPEPTSYRQALQTTKDCK